MTTKSHEDTHADIFRENNVEGRVGNIALAETLAHYQDAIRDVSLKNPELGVDPELIGTTKRIAIDHFVKEHDKAVAEGNQEEAAQAESILRSQRETSFK